MNMQYTYTYLKKYEQNKTTAKIFNPQTNRSILSLSKKADAKVKAYIGVHVSR